MNSFQNKLDSCFRRNDNPGGILTQWVQTEKAISGQLPRRAFARNRNGL